MATTTNVNANANINARIQSTERKLHLTIVVGLMLTLYGLFVEIKHDYSSSYVALCDISATVSCSAAFLSDYGRGFGLLPEPIAYRNPVFGIAFFFTLVMLVNFGKSLFTARVLFYLTIIANFGSLYLAYILTFILHVACVVCISLYAVNFFLLLFSWRRYKLFRSRQAQEQSSKRD